jgi:subtilisin family serine protease
MMNVTGVWKEGVTGKGVISALVDDGLDYESRDLAPNFVSGQSYQLIRSADNRPSMKQVHTTSTTMNRFQNQNSGMTSTELDVQEK